MLYIYFGRTKIGGAEMIGHREASVGNTQLFFIKTSDGHIRLKELVKLLLSKKNTPIITSLWKAHICVFLFSFLSRSNFKWIVFIHSTKFFHYIDSLVTRLVLLKAHFVIADGPESHLFISNYTKLPIEIYRTPLEDLMVAPWRFHRPFEYSFLFIGRIVSYKRVDRLVELAGKLSAKSVEYSITVAGPIEQEKSVDTQAFDLYGINYLGIVSSKEDKARLYMTNNFLINLSEVEGLGLSVVEGICNGLIPVITRVGELPNYCLEPHSIVWDPKAGMDDLVGRILNFNTAIFAQHSKINFRNLENYMNSKGKLLSDILQKHSC